MTPETLERHFDLLTDAPNAAKKLRKLVLQLAVRGKLVEQDPSDEPASVLLERIKRNSKLSSIAEDELPFELPEGWAWVRLGEVYELAYGKSLPKKARNDQGDVPVYGSNGVVGFHDEPLVTESSLVVGRKGSSGAVNLADQPFWAIDTTYFVTPSMGLELLYSYYLFKSLKLDQFDRATAIPGLNRNDAYVLVVGIPPTEEQKRIVAKVDELMGLIDRLEAQGRAKRDARMRFGGAALGSLLSTEDADTFAGSWRRVRDNFDLLCAAPESVAELRKAVLQLAVQGKLVPQDPEDEPAGVLLERLGLTIKDNSFTSEEMLFTLPSNWISVRLGELSTRQKPESVV